jgi:hypothetical protein
VEDASGASGVTVLLHSKALAFGTIIRRPMEAMKERRSPNWHQEEEEVIFVD